MPSGETTPANTLGFNRRALLPQGLALKMMGEVCAPRPLSCLCTWDGALGFNCGAWFLLPSGLGDWGSWWGLSSLVRIAYSVLPLLAWVLVARHTAFVTLLITKKSLVLLSHLFLSSDFHPVACKVQEIQKKLWRMSKSSQFSLCLNSSGLHLRWKQRPPNSEGWKSL